MNDCEHASTFEWIKVFLFIHLYIQKLISFIYGNITGKK